MTAEVKSGWGRWHMMNFIQTEPELAVGLGLIGLMWLCGLVADIHRRSRARKSPTRSPFGHWALTATLLWSLCAVSVWAWLGSGRSLEALGFRWGDGWGVLLAWAIALAFLGLQLAQLPVIRRDPAVQANLRSVMFASGDYDALMPRRRQDCWGFYLVGVTAGITEEVIFRAFLISVLALLMPLWLAALAAVAAFLLAHLYQGPQGLLRILPVTVVMTLTYILSGSLWPGIIIHVAVDVLAGLIVWLILPDEGYVSPEDELAEGGLPA